MEANPLVHILKGAWQWPLLAMINNEVAFRYTPFSPCKMRNYYQLMSLGSFWKTLKVLHLIKGPFEVEKDLEN